MNGTRIRDLEADDCVLLASLHVNYFGPSIIHDFGEKFLRFCYEGMVDARWGKTLVFVRNGESLGFATVVFDVRRFFREILARRGFVMGLEVLKTIARHPGLTGNVLRAARYPGTFAAETKAELLTLIVREDVRGAGTGSSLIEEVISILLEKQLKSFKVSVKKNWTRALDFYIRKGFEIIGEMDDGKEGLLFLRYDLTR